MLLASGAASLTFESLFFRLAAIAFGGSVIAASIVLCAFMSGLALGNILAARFGDRVRSPLRAYAMAELAIGISGCVVVAVLPGLGESLAPIFRPSAAIPALQNLERFLAAFVILLLPTTAMGITLPVILASGFRSDSNFGSVLGRLYAWNTAGGIIGVLAAEGLLVARLGITATAWAAAALNLAAACAAVALARDGAAPERAAAVVRQSWRSAEEFNVNTGLWLDSLFVQLRRAFA